MYKIIKSDDLVAIPLECSDVDRSEVARRGCRIGKSKQLDVLHFERSPQTASSSICPDCSSSDEAILPLQSLRDSPSPGDDSAHLVSTPSRIMPRPPHTAPRDLCVQPRWVGAVNGRHGDRWGGCQNDRELAEASLRRGLDVLGRTAGSGRVGARKPSTSCFLALIRAGLTAAEAIEKLVAARIDRHNNRRALGRQATPAPDQDPAKARALRALGSVRNVRALEMGAGASYGSRGRNHGPGWS